MNNFVQVTLVGQVIHFRGLKRSGILWQYSSGLFIPRIKVFIFLETLSFHTKFVRMKRVVTSMQMRLFSNREWRNNCIKLRIKLNKFFRDFLIRSSWKSLRYVWSGGECDWFSRIPKPISNFSQSLQTF